MTEHSTPASDAGPATDPVAEITSARPEPGNDGLNAEPASRPDDSGPSSGRPSSASGPANDPSAGATGRGARETGRTTGNTARETGPTDPTARNTAPEFDPTTSNADRVAGRSGRRWFAPGIGGVVAVGLVWLAAVLWSAHAGIRAAVDALTTVVDAALALPLVIAASLLAGLATAVGARGVTAARGRTESRPGRWGLAAAAGLVTGLVTGALVLLGYGRAGSIVVLAASVLVAALLGGLAAALVPLEVAAAGAVATFGAYLVAFVLGIFQGQLFNLLVAGNSAASRIQAGGRVALLTSLLSGIVAGLMAFGYLRRRTGARYPAYLLAGAAPGLLLLIAELVTRIGGAQLFGLAGSISPADRRLLAIFGTARIEHALIVLFAGAVAALIAFGRTLGPARR